MRALHDTSVRITQFVDARDRVAPPRPRPATWQQDVEAFDRFESETVTVYERRFGARVRAAHDLVSLRGLRDRDFDAFFRHPANEFQMRVIAKKLDGFSTALSKR
jgi:3-oxoacyl-[acyl-carrier-protein] synthase III